jgi:hypothetical protein
MFLLQLKSFDLAFEFFALLMFDLFVDQAACLSERPTHR